MSPVITRVVIVCVTIIQSIRRVTVDRLFIGQDKKKKKITKKRKTKEKKNAFLLRRGVGGRRNGPIDVTDDDMRVEGKKKRTVWSACVR